VLFGSYLGGMIFDGDSAVVNMEEEGDVTFVRQALTQPAGEGQLYYGYRMTTDGQTTDLVPFLTAMGLDCVLLDYEGHMAAGVLLDQPHGYCYALGDRYCCYCETTYLAALGEMPSRYAGEPVTVWEIGDSGLLRESLNSFCMGYRLSIQRIFGI
jgi:hypothetical protein